MFLSMLSAVDWAMIGEKIKGFFINWYNNELAFYLGLGGIILLFIAILCFILAASYKKAKKKADKADKKAKKAKQTVPETMAVEAAPAPAPANAGPVTPLVVKAPETVAAVDTVSVAAQPFETESFTAEPIEVTPAEAVAEPVETPVYTEPVAEPVEEETPRAFIPFSMDGDIDNDSASAEPYFEFQSYETFDNTDEETVKASDTIEEETSDAPAFEETDSSWKSAKINLKKPAAKAEKAASAEKPAEEEKPAKKAAPKKKVADGAPAEKKPVAKKAAPAKAEKATVAKAEKAADSKTEKAAVVTEENASAEKAAPADVKPKVVGKYVIVDNSYSYQFCLYANNGQLLFESREYASRASCKSGVATFKKNIPGCEYRVDVDKNGGYKYIFKKGNSLYIGETYSTAKAAERSAESVKRFVCISEIVE